MGLTSGAFVALMVGVAVGVLLAAVVLMPRLSGRWWHPPLRAVAILVVCVAALVATGAYLNSSNGWFASWEDLVGDAEPVQVAVAGAGAREAADAGAGGAAATSAPAPRRDLPALPDPGRRVQTYRVTGRTSGVTASVKVLLPAGYERHPERSYPVVEALHGFPGSPAGWLLQLDVQAQVDQAVAQRRMGEVIVVMPTVNVPASRDGECVDASPGGPNLEAWVARDVPEFIERTLRVERGRSSWAAMGYSAGAWCSAMVGVLHPDRFGAAVSLSGSFTPDFATGAPYAPGSAKARRYDLAARVAATAPPVALYLQQGRESEFWSQTQAFVAAVRAPTSVTTAYQRDSGHRWSTWTGQLPQVFAWLGGNIPGFAPR